MALYAFIFINHPGEDFETSTVMCRDDGHVLERRGSPSVQGTRWKSDTVTD